MKLCFVISLIFDWVLMRGATQSENSRQDMCADINCTVAYCDLLFFDWMIQI